MMTINTGALYVCKTNDNVNHGNFRRKTNDHSSDELVIFFVVVAIDVVVVVVFPCLSTNTYNFCFYLLMYIAVLSPKIDDRRNEFTHMYTPRGTHIRTKQTSHLFTASCVNRVK